MITKPSTSPLTLQAAGKQQGKPYSVEVGVAEHNLPDYVKQHLEPSEDGQLPRMKIQPLLASSVADFMERIKTFKMLGPCANHPSGFNMHVRSGKVKHDGGEVWRSVLPQVM